jgi:hypothetical protein
MLCLSSVCFFKTLVNFCWTTWHLILEDNNFNCDFGLQDVVPCSKTDTNISEKPPAAIFRVEVGSGSVNKPMGTNALKKVYLTHPIVYYVAVSFTRLTYSERTEISSI